MPHVPMRAGFEGDIAACDSIAGASGAEPFVGWVEEQAVTTSTVTSAAETAVPAATKCLDTESCSLLDCLDGPAREPQRSARSDRIGCRAFCGVYPGALQMATAN